MIKTSTSSQMTVLHSKSIGTLSAIVVFLTFIAPPLMLILLKKRSLALASIALIIASLVLAQIYLSMNNWPFPVWLFPLQVLVHFAAAWYVYKLIYQMSIPVNHPKIISFFVISCIGLLLIYYTIKYVVLSSYMIGSVSMNPTLIHGDYVLTQKMNTNLLQKPVHDDLFDYGDIVIFKHPVENEVYVKRIIAKAGDKVSFDATSLRINGKLLKREFIKSVTETPFRWLKNDLYFEYNNGNSYAISETGEPVELSGEITIPTNYVFVMGDNRNQSMDSRFWGLLPIQNILEKPLIIWWSIQPGFNPQIRWNRIGNPIN